MVLGIYKFNLKSLVLNWRGEEQGAILPLGGPSVSGDMTGYYHGGDGGAVIIQRPGMLLNIFHCTRQPPPSRSPQIIQCGGSAEAEKTLVNAPDVIFCKASVYCHVPKLITLNMKRAQYCILNIQLPFKYTGGLVRTPCRHPNPLMFKSLI